MTIDDLIAAWQAGRTDDVITALDEADAPSWDFYDSAIEDNGQDLERAALAFLGTD